MAQVLRASEVAGSWPAIVELFWATSARKAFDSIPEKTAFQDRYLGLYAKDFAEHVFLAMKGHEVVGYVLGVPDTRQATSILSANPHVAIFEDVFSHYPAHLHINCAASVQGQGIGTTLIAAFEEHLRGLGVRGLHLVTSPTARNVSFYERNGYAHKVERLWEGSPLLLLGKTLQA